MAGFENDVLVCTNVNFSPTAAKPHSGIVTADGQLLIGASVAPFLRASTLTAGAGISITNGSGTITITNTGGGGGGSLSTLTGNSGSAVAAGGVIAVPGTTGITTSGSGSTLTISPANDLAALEGLSGTGYAVRTASEVWALRTFQAGTGITLINGDGVSGNTTISATASVPTTFTADAGSATPVANNLNLFGSGSIATSAAGATVTTALTGLTNHNVLIGAGTSTITKVAPSATSGIPLISQGAAADPTFGTAVVAGGGTGQTTLTIHSILIGNSTSPIVSLATGSASQVLQSGGAGADPFWSTATFPSTATNVGSILRADGTNWVATTATYPENTTINQLLYSSANNVITGLAAGNKSVLTSGATGIPVWTSLATNGQLIIGSTAGVPAAATLTAGSGVTITNASNSITITASSVVPTTFTADSGTATPSANNINLLGSGSIATSAAGATVTTALTGLTNHNVLIGAGTATITKVAPSATSGVPLISQGAASDPAFGTAVVAGGGTGAISFTSYAVICGGTTSTNPLQSIASVGTSGQILTSNGAGALPTFQAFTPTFSPNSTLQIADDFLSPYFPTLTGSARWLGSILMWRDSQAWSETNATEAGHPGIISSASTSTSGALSFIKSESSTCQSILLGGGALTINWIFKMVTLSTVSNTYTLRMGLGDTTGSDANNGTYFEYTNGVNSGNWQIKTANASTRTTTNTATTVTTGWHNMQIDVNAAATSVTFTIDGVSQGSIVTNIPSSVPVMADFWFVVSNGTMAAGSVIIDLFSMSQTLTTPR